MFPHAVIFKKTSNKEAHPQMYNISRLNRSILTNTSTEEEKPSSIERLVYNDATKIEVIT